MSISQVNASPRLVFRHRRHRVQCDQIVFSLFGHLQQYNFAQKYTYWAKVS